jgi:Fe-S cluster biogenesis protein NfuA
MALETNKIRQNVEKALEKIRGLLQADGGDIELVDVKEGVVKVRLKGACSGCPLATMTLRNAVEKIIKEQVPEITSVEAIE